MNFSRLSILFGLLLLPSAALVSGLLQRRLSPPALVSADPAAALRAEIENEGFRWVARPELDKLLQAGQHLLLDARDLRDYAAGHLPGAQSLPLRDFEATFPELLPVIASGMPMLLYCSGPRCDDALHLARRLRETGFADATIYVGGWEDWSAP